MLAVLEAKPQDNGICACTRSLSFAAPSFLFHPDGGVFLSLVTRCAVRHTGNEPTHNGRVRVHTFETTIENIQNMYTIGIELLFL